MHVIQRVTHSVIIHIGDDVHHIEVHIIVAPKFVCVDKSDNLAISQLTKLLGLYSGRDGLAVELVPVRFV